MREIRMLRLTWHNPLTIPEGGAAGFTRCSYPYLRRTKIHNQLGLIRIEKRKVGYPRQEFLECLFHRFSGMIVKAAD